MCVSVPVPVLYTVLYIIYLYFFLSASQFGVTVTVKDKVNLRHG